MRVALDYTAATQGAGIGRYTRELAQALIIQAREHTFQLIVGRDFPPQALPRWAQDDSRVSWTRLPFTSRQATVLWHRLRVPLPLELFTDAIDLFHGTDYLLPPLRRTKGIITVHDLSFFLLPEAADPRLARFLQRALPRSLARADMVVADSERTRRDLLGLFTLDPERVVTVPLGVSPRFRRVTEPAALEAVRRRYHLPAAFVLFVATIEPRKNLVRLVEAYDLLRRELRQAPPLVLAGGAGWRNEPLFQRIASLELEDAVHFIGFVREEDLPALLSAATVFVYPSLYEGFGLPPLEALACGTPVVATTAGALPEVLGSAALLVDPEDVQALAEALHRALTDEEVRLRAATAGPEQAARYTWEGAAQRMLSIYERVAAGG